MIALPSVILSFAVPVDISFTIWQALVIGYAPSWRLPCIFESTQD